MKLAIIGVTLFGLSVAITVQTGVAQTPATVKVLGCLQGDGSAQKPWTLSGVALPAAAAPGRGAAPAPLTRTPLVELKLVGGLNMAPWRGMKIEVEGTLGAKPATGLQELRATAARSVQGVCIPK